MTSQSAKLGLQRERTILAWNRTAVSVAAVGLLLGRFAAANPFSLRELPALLGVGAGAWIIWVTSARPGGLDRDGVFRLRGKRTAAVAVIAVTLGLAALVLTLVDRVAGV